MAHDTVCRDDYLWGAPAIAPVLNVSTRQAYYLLENGLVPARKVGTRWVVRRDELDAFMCSELDRKANDEDEPDAA